MSDENTDNLILEILKVIQLDLSELKGGNRDIKQEIISLRKQIHNMQGDTLRQEQTIASIHLELDRIKSRLNLVDDTH